MVETTWACLICGEDNPATNDMCECGGLRPDLVNAKSQRESGNEKSQTESATTSGEPAQKKSKKSKWDEGAGANIPLVFDKFALIFKTVAVLGLSSKPELNGKTAIVKEFDGTANRYVVEMEGGLGVFKLKSDNLFEFAVIGKKVGVHGVASKPELNGSRGVVKHFDMAADRYTIEVDGGLGTFRFKASNLRDLTHAVEPQNATAGAAGPTAETPAGPPAQTSSAQPDPAAPGMFNKSIKIAVNQKGLIIGKGGENIKRIQQESGAKIEVESRPGYPDEPFVLIRGFADQIEVAERMVQERLLSARDRIMRQVAMAAKNMDLSEASSNFQRHTRDTYDNATYSASRNNTERSWSSQEDGYNDRGWQSQKQSNWEDWRESGTAQESQSRGGVWKDDSNWDAEEAYGRSGRETQRKDDQSSWNSWTDRDSNTKWSSERRSNSTWSNDSKNAGAWRDEGANNYGEEDAQAGSSGTWGDWSKYAHEKNEGTAWTDHSRGGNGWSSEKSGNETWKSYDKGDTTKSKFNDSSWDADTVGGSGWGNAKWDSSETDDHGSWRRNSW